MATQAPPKPLPFPLAELLNPKAIYDRAEAFWTVPLQTLFGTETFVTAMANTREQVLTQHGATKDALESQWAALRLPSLADHARLAGMIVSLEAKLEAVDDRFEESEAQLKSVTARFVKTEAQLDRVEERLATAIKLIEKLVAESAKPKKQS